MRVLMSSIMRSLIFSRITLGKRVSAAGVIASNIVSGLALTLVLRSRLLINTPSPINSQGSIVPSSSRWLCLSATNESLSTVYYRTV